MDSIEWIAVSANRSSQWASLNKHNQIRSSPLLIMPGRARVNVVQTPNFTVCTLRTLVWFQFLILRIKNCFGRHFVVRIGGRKC